MRLASYLALSNRTATELARACHVSVPTITRIAKGTKKPSLDLAERIRTETRGAVRADDYLPPYEEPSVEPVLAAAGA